MSSTELQILRFPPVIFQTGLSKSTIYKKITAGIFPPPLSIGYRAVGFSNLEINAYIKAVIQQKSESEMRTLITELVTKRGDL